MLTRRTTAFRQIAELLEQICAAEGLEIEATTIDAAIRIRVASVAAELGVTDRTALNYAPPETFAAHLADTLKTTYQLNQAEDPSNNRTTVHRARFRRDTLVVHTTAPTDTICARCDGPIAAGEPAVFVPGLHRRGMVHQICVPTDPRDGDIDA